MATQSFAGLMGSTITASSFKIGSVGVGYTPATALIDGSVEMGWSFSNPFAFVIHTADFADTTLTLNWSQSGAGFGSTESTFTNSAFTGLSVSVLSTTIPGGLGGLSLVGDKLTVFAVNLNGNPANYNAVIQFDGFAPPSGGTVPEPSSFVIIGIGFVALSWRHLRARGKQS